MTHFLLNIDTDCYQAQKQFDILFFLFVRLSLI